MNIFKWFATIIFNLFRTTTKKVKYSISSKELKEIDEKIEDIKNKYDEREMAIRNYEYQIKLIETYNKHYDFKIKLMDIKGKILNDCLSIIKDVMTDIKKI